jgi:hypothetical protein
MSSSTATEALAFACGHPARPAGRFGTLRRAAIGHTSDARTPPLTFTAMRKLRAIGARARPTTVVVLAVGLLALAGCGESSQAKANKQVCAARSDISKQIRTLTVLTLSSSSANTARASFEAIGRDVTQIKAAQAKLDSSRKRVVETATHDFVTQVGAIAAALTSNLSPGNAAAQFKAALGQLAGAYNQTLASINC